MRRPSRRPRRREPTLFYVCVLMCSGCGGDARRPHAAHWAVDMLLPELSYDETVMWMYGGQTGRAASALSVAPAPASTGSDGELERDRTPPYREKKRGATYYGVCSVEGESAYRCRSGQRTEKC